MKSSQIIQASGLVLGVLTASLIAMAAPSPAPCDAHLMPPPPPGPPPCGFGGPAEMKKKFAEALQLSPEQQTRIDAIHESFHHDRESQWGAMRKLIETGAPKEALLAQLDTLIPAPRHMEADHQRMDAKIKMVLTPQQAEKLDVINIICRPPLPPSEK